MSDIHPDEKIALLAMEACIGTPGVAEMVGGVNNISAFLGMEWPAKGVKLTRDKEFYTVDVYLNVHFNSKIPEVAWNVQENVKNSLRQNTDIKIEKVNIHIQGVAFAEGLS